MALTETMKRITSASKKTPYELIFMKKRISVYYAAIKLIKRTMTQVHE